ncbi:MAG: hypothetical protein QW117_01880 [Candidatus Pacearchaeota archaeon]
MIKKFIEKKAQEEIVGFIIIIVLIIIIGLFFLFLMSKQQKKDINSNQIESFLNSLILHTTSCYLEEKANPLNIQYLIDSCLNKKNCSNGEETCFVLNKTISSLLENSFVVDEESKYKGYNFKIFSAGSIILEIKKGNSTINYYSSYKKIISSYEELILELKVYF